MDRFNNLPTTGLGLVGLVVAGGVFLSRWIQGAHDHLNEGTWIGIGCLCFCDGFAQLVEKIGDELGQIGRALEKSRAPIKRKGINVRILCFFGFLAILLLNWLEGGSMRPADSIGMLGFCLFSSLGQSVEDILKRLKGISKLLLDQSQTP